MHNDDFIETLITCSTHDLLLFFTNKGKVFKMKAYELPEYGRTAKGIPAINLLGIDSGESIEAVVNVRGEVGEGLYLFFTTRQGTVKRTPVTEFANIRTNGLRAITLKEDDELMNVTVTDGKQNIIIGTHEGYAVSFLETDVRSMGRTARGVRGIRLRGSDYVVGMNLLKKDSEVLVITENGYGKRTAASEYAIRGRGGKGVKTANVTKKNGNIIGLTTVTGKEDIMLITDAGVIIRMGTDTISQTGRVTLGVRLMRLGEGTLVSTMAKVEPEEEKEVELETILEEGSSEDPTEVGLEELQGDAGLTENPEIDSEE